MPLHSVEPQRLYRQIADQLRKLIGKGEFVVGARLPAERDLARQLGVSRPSVREALIALEVEGWVEVRTGSGVYVLNRSSRAAQTAPATEWGPLELIRARRVVEGEIAAIAATNRTRKDLDAMARAIAAMRKLAEHDVAPLEGDRAFHVAIVESCDNVVLVETVQGFWDSRKGVISMRLGGHFETARVWRLAIAEHQSILETIAARDADAARHAMHLHMDRSHSRFSASWRRAMPA
ncbi:MAG: FadR/GntR family transcriptional regulator [Burkholderiaceae bacterium]